MKTFIKSIIVFTFLSTAMKKTVKLILILVFSTSLVFGQSYSGGSGTSSDPYLIATKADLKYLSENSSDWDKYFKQTADITFSSSDFQSGGDFYNGGEFFIPIGNGTTYFTGSYNGDGHKISNLKINRGSTNYIGFFGYVNSSYEIKNLELENVDITGYVLTGSLEGYSAKGTISNCYSTGTISGYGNVGGFVGFNNLATISNCYSTASAGGQDNVGGLVGGTSSGSINNCYSTGMVNGTSGVGGLVGYNSFGTISNCYSTGTVSGSSNSNVIGGLVGDNYPAGLINNSFWDTEASGQSSSAGGTGKTTPEMKTMSTFTNAGWDFTNTWAISSAINNGYPYLQGVTPLPVELTSFIATTIGSKVELTWHTATEVNNYGFDIERSPLLGGEQKGWVKIGFAQGSGNSNSPKSYSFVDNKPLVSSSEYRLKQIDNDGAYKYSKVVTVSSSPTQFGLSQNYPNPFNPVTTIKYSIPKTGYVSLNIYDELGRKVASLVNENKEAGNYEVQFDGSSFASGIYFYRILAGNFVDAKKLILLK